MAKIVTYKCPSCAAPLRIGDNIETMNCSYCKHPIVIERDKPRPQDNERRDIIYILSDPPASTLSAKWTVALVLGLVFVPVLAKLLPRVIRSAQVAFSPFPLRCGRGESVVLRDRVYRSVDHTLLMVAESGCTLELVRCRLDGALLLRVEPGSQVLVQESDLSSDRVAVEVMDGATLSLSRKSSLRGTIALRARAAATIAADDSSIAGTEIGIQGDMATVIRLTNHSRITGGQIAVQARQSLELEVQDSIIESEGDAIYADFSSVVTAQRAQIRGGKHALTLSATPRQLRLVETQVVGLQVFDRR